MAKRNIIANIAAAKRIVCLGTAVFVAVAAARAATTVEIDGTTWTYTLSSGNATITAVAPADGTLIVPSEIDGHPVTTIRYNVGKGCENITSLVVADSVKTIGYGAFALCASLGEVVLGDGVTTIGSSTSANSNPTAGNYAFGGCAALTNVVFGSSLVTLNGSFCKCTALERVVLPESLVTIGADAFFGCERLISAEFGGNVATIGGYAFGGCQRLRYLRFHGDPPTVKNGAFNQMKSPAIVFREDDNGEWPETWRDYVVKPASEMTADADAPYDFAFHKVSKWPDSFFLTDGTNSFDACTKFFAGDPIYTAMAARDFWGDADLSHNVTNTLYVSGVSVTGRLVFLKTLMAGRPEGAIFPSLPLQNLAPGEYTATWVLNEPRSIRETNYANNSNSVSFVVVPATTVTFISEGKEVESRRYASGEPYGSFPTLEERAGFELSGWFTAEENGTRVTASSTVPASTTTLYAKWGPAPDADGVVRVEIDGTTWSYTLSNGDATIIAVAPASGSMVIPSEFYGHPVTGVRSSAFQGTSIESVVIPDSVVTMDQQAFENCPMLTNAVIGSGLAVVPARMFNNCGRLSAVTFKEGVEEIDEYAFYGTALKAVSLPSSMRKIGEGAFYGIACLERADLNDGLQTIETLAFHNCTALGVADLPATLTSIGGYAFSRCASLASVTLPLANVGASAFSDCTGLKTVVIPRGGTSIGDHLFSGCTGLESVTIPDTVTSIGNAFSDCTGLRTVSIPDSVIEIRDYAFSGCSSLESLTIPGSVASIGAYAFKNCTSLWQVVLNDGLEVIGNYAFNNCTSLRDLTLPPTLTTIGQDAFEKCASLTTLVIPDSVTGIGKWAFADCKGLETLTIGNGVASIGNDAFRGCFNLASVTIPESVEYLGGYVFADCGGLESAVIGGGVALIRDYSFYNCTNLASVVIGGGVSSIGDNAFFYCDNLQCLTLKGDVFSGESALPWGNVAIVYYSPEYEENWLPVLDGHGIANRMPIWEDDQAIQSEVVDGRTWSFYLDNGGAVVCSGRWGDTVLPVEFGDELVIPATLGGFPVVGIGQAAFAGLSGASSIVVPATVTGIAANAFNGCMGLRYMRFLSSGCDAVADTAFENVNPNVVVYVPDNATGFGDMWNGFAVRRASEITADSNAEWDLAFQKPADWPAPFFLATGRNSKVACTRFPAGSSIFVNYSFVDEWGDVEIPKTVTHSLSVGNSGETQRFHMDCAVPPGMTVNGVGEAPSILRNLAPGEYTVTLTLNEPRAIRETSYANNSLSLAFIIAPSTSTTFLSGYGDGVVGTFSFEKGGTYGTLPSPPVRSGYRFLGWFTAAEGGERITENTPVPDTPANLFAHWEEAPDEEIPLPERFRWDDVNGKCYTTPVKTQAGADDQSYAYAAMDCLETMRLIDKGYRIGKDWNALTDEEKQAAQGPVAEMADIAAGSLDATIEPGLDFAYFVPAVTKCLNWMLNTGFDGRRVVDFAVGAYFYEDYVFSDQEEVRRRPEIIREIKSRILRKPLLARYQHVDEWHAQGPYFYYPVYGRTQAEDKKYYRTELIIGYDDTIPASSFHVEHPESEQIPGDGAWIVKGSYGTSYGDNGYYYISYYDRNLFSYSSSLGLDLGNYSYELGVEEPGQYADFYGHHIDTPCAFTPAYDDEGLYFACANVFTAERDGVVNAVGFFTMDAQKLGSHISAYVDCAADDPTSGTCVVSVERHQPFSSGGYHVVQLKHPFEVKEGQRFSIVVKQDWLGLVHNPSAQKGRSFSKILSEEHQNDGWSDLTESDHRGYFWSSSMSSPEPNEAFITAYTAGEFEPPSIYGVKVGSYSNWDFSSLAKTTMKTSSGVARNTTAMRSSDLDNNIVVLPKENCIVFSKEKPSDKDREIKPIFWIRNRNAAEYWCTYRGTRYEIDTEPVGNIMFDGIEYGLYATTKPIVYPFEKDDIASPGTYGERTDEIELYWEKNNSSDRGHKTETFKFYVFFKPLEKVAGKGRRLEKVLGKELWYTLWKEILPGLSEFIFLPYFEYGLLGRTRSLDNSESLPRGTMNDIGMKFDLDMTIIKFIFERKTCYSFKNELKSSKSGETVFSDHPTETMMDSIYQTVLHENEHENVLKQHSQWELVATADNGLMWTYFDDPDGDGLISSQERDNETHPYNDNSRDIDYKTSADQELFVRKVLKGEVKGVGATELKPVGTKPAEAYYSQDWSCVGVQAPDEMKAKYLAESSEKSAFVSKTAALPARLSTKARSAPLVVSSSTIPQAWYDCMTSPGLVTYGAAPDVSFKGGASIDTADMAANGLRFSIVANAAIAADLTFCAYLLDGDGNALAEARAAGNVAAGDFGVEFVFSPDTMADVAQISKGPYVLDRIGCHLSEYPNGASVWSASPLVADIDLGTVTWNSSCSYIAGDGSCEKTANGLEISLPVYLPAAGTYEFTARLVTEGGETAIAVGTCTATVSDLGIADISLLFAKTDLFRSKHSGKFVLQSLLIRGGNASIADWLVPEFTTPEYSYAEFEPDAQTIFIDPASFSDKILYDGDGEAASLAISFSAVNQDHWRCSIYRFKAILSDGNGREVARLDKTLPMGKYSDTYTLEFPCAAIRDAGVSGPYVLSILTISEADSWVTLDAFTSASFKTVPYDITSLLLGKYTIEFDKCGGSGGTASVTATYGAAMPSITVPSLEGYVFGGYWTEPNGAGTKYYTASGTSARDWNVASATTLYAFWSLPATVTIDPKDGPEAIQATLEAANDGDTILVSPGTYSPIDATGRKIEIRAVIDPDAPDAVPVIDGGGVTRCATLGDGAVLSGFILRNGRADFCGGVLGGKVENCYIENCAADVDGGGLYEGTAENTVIAYCEAGGFGGGAYHATLTGCTVYGCVATTGAGVAGSQVANSIVWENRLYAVDKKGVHKLGNCANVTEGKKTLYKNTCTYTDSSPKPAGAGNLAKDPLFMDAANGDFRLQWTSPVKDKGKASLAAGDSDLGGLPRLVGAPDMGAYEIADGTPVPADYDGDGVTDAAYFDAATATWIILQSRDGLLNVKFGDAKATPVPADYDGDGRADFATYLATAKAPVFRILTQLGEDREIALGEKGATPFAADIDGDGIADPGVFQGNAKKPSFTVLQSALGWSPADAFKLVFGTKGAKAVIGDFDCDGKADLGCYTSTASKPVFKVALSGQGMSAAAPLSITLGAKSSEPCCGDFDGDGATDFAAYSGTAKAPLLYRMFSTSKWREVRILPFGQKGSRATTGDWDGNGAADAAIEFRGQWWYVTGDWDVREIPAP